MLCARAGALLLVVSACGSGSGAAGTSSHDSPDGAARGFVNALAANDTKGAEDWIASGERSEFSGALDEARSLKLKVAFTVKAFSVASVAVDRSDANRAVVTYGGQVTFCVTGTTAGRAVDDCSAVQSQSGQGNAHTFVCVRQDGRWYVSIRGTAA